MTVLVLGGCGFIGSHVVDALLAEGRTVRVLGRSPERFRAPLPGVEYLFGSYDDPALLARALTGCEAVFHLVSSTFPGTAPPAADVRGNLLGTLAVMEVMRDAKVRRLLFISSGGTVYGIPEHVPIPEDHPLRPIGSYGIVKVAIESYLWMYRAAHGLSPVVLRPSNPYGARQGHLGVQGVVATLMDRAITGLPMTVWGDGTVVRDFVDVRDVADLAVRAGLSEVEGTFNVGSGVGTSVNDLIEAVRDVTGRPLNVEYAEGRGVDVPVSVLDCSAARTAFGWQARYGIREGLDQVWRWRQVLATSGPVRST